MEKNTLGVSFSIFFRIFVTKFFRRDNGRYNLTLSF